jgi:hypothetical protein
VKGDKRTFTLASIEGGQINNGDYGYYKSTSPSGAAKKAATQWFRGGGVGTSKVVLEMKEITSGGTGKIFSYIAKKVKVS